MRKRDGDPLKLLCCWLSCLVLGVDTVIITSDFSEKDLWVFSSSFTSVGFLFDSELDDRNLSMMLERDPAFLMLDTTELSLPPREDSLLGLGRPPSGPLVATKEPSLVKDLDDQL